MTLMLLIVAVFFQVSLCVLEYPILKFSIKPPMSCLLTSPGMKRKQTTENNYDNRGMVKTIKKQQTAMTEEENDEILLLLVSRTSNTYILMQYVCILFINVVLKVQKIRRLVCVDDIPLVCLHTRPPPLPSPLPTMFLDPKPLKRLPILHVNFTHLKPKMSFLQWWRQGSRKGFKCNIH